MSLVDPRVVEHARILVNYSCKVKRGDTVLILANAEAIPLVREIAREVGRNGGSIVVSLMDDSINRAYALAADQETLASLPEAFEQMILGADVLVEIRSDWNTKEMGDVPREKMMVMQASFRRVQEAVMRKRWTVTLHPTPALAQEAGKSLEAYADFVYGAILVDWPAMARKMTVLAEKMAGARKVRITGTETDLTLSVEGRKPIVDSGETNLPGGEVFTSPVEDSANGTIYFDKPVIHLGQEMSGVHLTFKDGVVTEHRAETGGKALEATLAIDEGAKRLGELGIGMNRGITEFSKSILFDEKMGDTIHMAIGLGFEGAGGKNRSAIHVDMIKGMKEGGTIYFDDEPIYSGGKFIWE